MVYLLANLKNVFFHFFPGYLRLTMGLLLHLTGPARFEAAWPQFGDGLWLFLVILYGISWDMKEGYFMV